jgi:Type IV secretion system pilin
MNIGDTLFNSIKGTFNPSDTANGLTGIGGLVTVFLNAAFALSGLILLFFFIMGGIGMISSAGQSDPQKAEQAKKTITSAIIGFVIVFTSYWIVKLIGSLLGIQDLIF